MVGTEFFDVTTATDDHNEDIVSVESRQGIVVVNNGSTSASYVEVDETLIEDYGEDVLKLDAGKEALDQEEPSENDEMVNELYTITTEFTKSSIY